MSNLWIETDKGRLYIQGDDAVEMIIPPGYKLQLELIPVNRLPDIPPITANLSEEQAKEIAEEIRKSIELRLTSGVPPMEGM